jgi:MtN3 and saliva related transmembrane protein
MIEFIGFSAGIIGVVAYIPQAVKTLRTRSTAGLSLPMLCLIWLSTILWAVYGFFKPSVPLILTNASIVVISGVIIIAVIIKRRKEKK